MAGVKNMAPKGILDCCHPELASAHRTADASRYTAALRKTISNEYS